MSSISTSTTSAIETFLQYVESCIYVYLHNRKVYPENTFDRKRAFDVVVHSSRQPELISYVQDTLHGLKGFIERGQLRQVCAALRDEKGNIAERLDIELLGLDSREGCYKLSSLLAKDLARAGLVRLSRMQLPEVQVASFSLVFEVDYGPGGSDSVHDHPEDDSQKWIVHDTPSLDRESFANPSPSKQSAVPIVTFGHHDVPQRICLKIETTMI